MPEERILLVDDEPHITEMLRYNLEREEYEVEVAQNGREAIEKAAAFTPDLIILDVMMPEMDGIEVTRRLRQDAHLRLTPILMLTAKDTEQDEVAGLDAGADDYLIKGDVTPRLLLSRVRALLRRQQRDTEGPDVLRAHDLDIDRSRYQVVRREEAQEEVTFQLPRKEFELLYFLAAHPGKVFSRQDLLDQIWGTDVYVVDRTVDVHIRRIREKLGSAYIETVKGVGYKFAEEIAA